MPEPPAPPVPAAPPPPEPELAVAELPVEPVEPALLFAELCPPAPGLLPSPPRAPQGTI